MLSTTKIYQYLSVLNPYELNSFQKFLASPVFNQDPELLTCFQLLAPYFKNNTAPSLSKQAVWQQLFPKKKYNDLRFRRLLSDLLQKAESFLAFRKYQQHPINEGIYLLEALNEKKLDKYFDGTLHYFQHKLEHDTFLNSEYYFQRYQIELQHSVHLENKNLRSTEKNLAQTLYSLDHFYLLNKLRFSAATLHYKTIVALQEESFLLKEILVQIEKTLSEQIPMVAIYYHIILTLTEPNQEVHFQNLNLLLNKHHGEFSISDARELYAYALNYCIRKINQGNIPYQKKIFELYKQMLKANLLHNNGFISPWDFKNIITISLRIKEYAWTEKFIEQYQHQIPIKDRKNAYAFNMARYYFAKKKYQLALPLLQEVAYDDVFYLLDSKSTLFKIYYELGEYTAMQSLKESFRLLLRRKKLISERHRTNYENFLKLSMKLYRADVKNKKQMKDLKALIATTNDVADKSWIQEKLAELME
jgi:hypothetical protein